MTKENKLGNEKIGKLLFTLSLPAIVAQIVNVLYTMVDRVYIGNMEGSTNAMAALSVALPLITLIIAFTRLLGVGGAPLCAIKMGENNKDEAERIMTNSFVMLIMASVIITVVTLIFKEPLLTMFGADAATLPLAVEYIEIYALGTIFVQISLGMNSYITTQGFARISMTTVLVGAITNIILDPIFIFGMNMGVKGAALATIIAQGVSAVWVLSFLFGKKSTIKIRKEYIIPKAKIVFSIVALGISPFTMSATESLLQIAFNNQLSQFGGMMAVGVMAVLLSLWQFITLPLDGLTQGAQPIMSYNYGAKNYARVRETFKVLLITCVVIGVSMTSLIVLFAPIFSRIFVSDPTTVIFSAWAVRIFMLGGLLFGIQICCQQTFMALGQAKQSLAMALFRKVVLLIPLIYIMPNIIGDSALATNLAQTITAYVPDGARVFAVLVCEPISDSIAALTTASLFYMFYKKHLCVDLNQEKEG